LEYDGWIQKIKRRDDTISREPPKPKREEYSTIGNAESKPSDDESSEEPIKQQIPKTTRERPTTKQESEKKK